MKTRSQKLNSNSSAANKPKIVKQKNRKEIDTKKNKSIRVLTRNQVRTGRVAENVHESIMGNCSESNEKTNILRDNKENENYHVKTRSKIVVNNEKLDATQKFEHALKGTSSKRSNTTYDSATVSSRNKEMVKCTNEDYRVFVVGDLVWAKLRGWPAWPAKVGYFSIFIGIF